ncbi:hypothetical protein CVS40_12746 [Lucilia cuprina]|nr:hypothetical protein CVS40_12746 [Lucilia cuprina]
METRNSSRGNRNSSSGQGRGSSATRNNVSAELQSSTSSPKPRVVHSPANRQPPTQQIHRPQSSNSLPSSTLFQDIQLLSNQNSASEPHVNISCSERAPVEPTMNPVNEQFSLPSNNAPLVLNNSASSLDSLIALMQQTMRNTQEEFRKELTSIRASIAQIGSVPTSNVNRQPEFFTNFTESNTPVSNSNRPSDNQSRYSANSETNIKLEKWKITYNGSGSVSDFLFKVETLCARSRCPDDHLLSNFHVLLEGKAEEWYWLFTKQNRNVTYPLLRQALTKEFGHLESDHDVLLKISLRKQQFKESYDDFHSVIVSMNLRLQNPLPDVTLIEIMKRNINSNLRFLLFNTETQNLNEFRDTARKAEKVIRETKFQNPNTANSRNVNEINLPLSGEEDSEGTDPQIDAIQVSNRRIRYDYSNIKCWNCMSLGHSYIYCTQEIKQPFCFKCGYKGVFTPNCPNKHNLQGNRKVGELATGDTRPPPHTPSST